MNNDTMHRRGKLFNATCDGCREFRPRCGKVRLRKRGKAGNHNRGGDCWPVPDYDGEARTLCEECRARLHTGTWRFDVEEKSHV